jgi:hypothetical protein
VSTAKSPSGRLGINSPPNLVIIKTAKKNTPTIPKNIKLGTFKTLSNDLS